MCGLNTQVGKILIGIGSAVWAWWLSPVGSPFILIVTFTSIGIKSLYNILRRKKYNEKNYNKEKTKGTD